MEKSITVLKRIEQENEQENVWIVGPETGRLLYWLTRVVNPEVVVEIGTSVGYSAITMARALVKNGRGRLWTVESHDERFERARANIAEAGLEERIVQVKGHAPEVFLEDPSMPAHVDMAFFDATKSETQSFFDAVYPRMSSGGLIAVDNVVSHRFEMMDRFIRFMHEHPKLEVVELPVGSGLLLARLV